MGDASVYYASQYVLIHLFGAGNPTFQKVLGLIAGVTTTYLYNSRITFNSAYSLKSFFRYSSTQIFGMLVNLVFFSFAVIFLEDYLALILATGAASIFNYFGAKYSLK